MWWFLLLQYSSLAEYGITSSIVIIEPLSAGLDLYCVATTRVYNGASNKGPSKKGTTSHKGLLHKVSFQYKTNNFEPLRRGQYNYKGQQGWAQSVLTWSYRLHCMYNIRRQSVSIRTLVTQSSGLIIMFVAIPT